MKKAKVLIPAIAVLALSAASAVTGTVAWFTASRTASTSASNITVVNAEASLKVTAAAGTGMAEVTDDGSTSNTPKLKHEALRDGSVDIATGKVYGLDLNPDGTIPGEKTYTDYTSNFDQTVIGQKKIFRAAKYTLTFELKSKIPEGDVYGLFLDGNATKTHLTSGDSAGSISEALRLGFRTTSPKNNEAVVIAPSATRLLKAATATDTYVNGSAETQYAAPQIANEGTVSEYDSANSNFLGNITNDAGTINTITVDVYTWFEGSDASCVNEKAAEAATYELAIGFNLLKQAK